jgi:predicted acyl esterase
MIKRNALLIGLVLCCFAPVFEDATTIAGGTGNAETGAKDGRTDSNSSMAHRVSKPGEYAGYSEAIYDNKYELTSRYVQVSDGTKLAMDLYRHRDKSTGRVIDIRLPVLWMHTPYNRRYSNDKALTGESYPGTAVRLVKYGYVVAI